MLSGAKRNRNISDFSGRLGFREKRGMTLGICEIFNAQILIWQFGALGLQLPKSLVSAVVVPASEECEFELPIF